MKIKDKDYPARTFTILCSGIAVLFAAVGVLACLSSIGLGWKIFAGITTGLCTYLYALIAWKCRP